VKRNGYRILVGKPEGKRPRGRPRRRRVDNIKMDLREIGWDVVDWIQRVGLTVEHLCTAKRYIMRILVILDICFNIFP
jgi:hypothetical protein